MGRWRNRTSKYKHIKKKKRLRTDRSKVGGSRTTKRRGTKTKVVPGSTKGSGGRKQSKGTKFRYAMGTKYHPKKEKGE